MVKINRNNKRKEFIERSEKRREERSDNREKRKRSDKPTKQKNNSKPIKIHKKPNTENIIPNRNAKSIKFIPLINKN